MDWIESIFGLSPDGGDGTTEAMIVFAACAVIGIIIYARAPRVTAYVRKWLLRATQPPV
jgi:hypothetical protein